MKNKTLILSATLILVFALSACSLGSVAGNLSQTSTNSTDQNTAVATVAPESTAPAAVTQPTENTAAPVVSSNSTEALAAIQGTLSQIYDQMNPAVVNIEVTKTVTASQTLPFGSPFDTPQGGSQVEQALGSGFIWDKLGHIVTNNHVVSDATAITVRFSDGTTADATLVGADPDSDLAVIKVDVPTDKLVPVTLADSDKVEVGQLAIAIGNPYGLEGTMTVGIISALGRSLDSSTTSATSYTIPDVIQTDAPINPGNSGGVLLDVQGQVVGVTAAIESSSNSNAGIGFVIPSNIVARFVPGLISDGRVQHTWLGISGTTMTSELAKAMNLPENTTGAVVFTVTSGGPADKAGIQGSTQQATIQGQSVDIGGDVITAIDGTQVKTFDDLVSYLTLKADVGQKVTLDLLRNGKTESVEVTLGSRPTTDQQQASSVQTANRGGYLGISGATMSPAIAQEMNVDSNVSGVLVVSVTSGSPADDAGLKGGTHTVTINGTDVPVGGDIITKVDGTKVESIQALRELLTNYYPGDVITLTILRDGSEMPVTVTLAELP